MELKRFVMKDGEFAGVRLMTQFPGTTEYQVHHTVQALASSRRQTRAEDVYVQVGEVIGTGEDTQIILREDFNYVEPSALRRGVYIDLTVLGETGHPRDYHTRRDVKRQGLWASYEAVHGMQGRLGG